MSGPEYRSHILAIREELGDIRETLGKVAAGQETAIGLLKNHDERIDAIEKKHSKVSGAWAALAWVAGAVGTAWAFVTAGGIAKVAAALAALV
jgi:hypothetical protein